MSDQGYGLTLSAAPALRRGSTPLPIKHQLKREEAVSEDYDWTPGLDETATPQISISNALDSPPPKPPQQKYHGPLRIVLLGQNGVGKSSLALCLAGLSDRSLSLDSETQAAGKDNFSLEPFFRSESFLRWMPRTDLSTLQCEVCILVFSLTDRRTFHRIAQLRLLLRETLPHTPLILVGNKSDLVRSREISIEEAHSSAMMFGCLYLELSVSLDHHTNDLLEAAVRAARGHSMGLGWTEGSPTAARRESLTTRAKRFLSGLVPEEKADGWNRDTSKMQQQSSKIHRNGLV
ncbi:GTP-binding protein REM 2 [Triplophysa tibetana]|uniref:GTP-binding protein REM 2 n=1 Tax=Triplophysa tibetana TaxID=1572043 RepID=A0A5A9PAX2_9TELE|nr:GTP-binding protein REM 2 [Triplophysa tibetana]